MIGRWKKGETGSLVSRTKIQKAKATKVSGLYRVENLGEGKLGSWFVAFRGRREKICKPTL